MKFDKFTDVCMTRGIRHTPSHTDVCKFFIFQPTFSQLKLHLICATLQGTQVNVLFLVLVHVFNFNLLEFSAAILEKGLFDNNRTKNKIQNKVPSCSVTLIQKYETRVLFMSFRLDVRTL